MHTVIIALGSNVYQTDNIDAASAFISERFEDVAFSEYLWTDPIDIASDRFLNRLAFVKTSMALNDLKQLLKDMEVNAGSTREEREKGIIKIDVDLLIYDDKRYHLQDWNRDYIKQLIAQNPFV